MTSPPILPILAYPHPGLKRICAAVTVFGPPLSALADSLAATMRAAPGIGITAAHVGIFERLAIIQLDPGDPVLAYVNPQVVWSSEATASHAEGSVSMPGVTDLVTRPSAVRVRYQDLDGAPREVECDGLLAVCLQHEIDQLDGIFWLDRLSRLKRDRLVKKWQKQNR